MNEQPKKVVHFKYDYKNYDKKDASLEYPIELPYKECALELSHRIVSEKMHQMMKLLQAEDQLQPKLLEFIVTENQRYYDEWDEEIINKANNKEIDIEQVVRDTEKWYKDEILKFSDNVPPSDEEIFADSFNRLVHAAGMLPDILTKEHAYSEVIASMSNQMDNEIESLNSQHQQEVDSQIQQLDITTTSEDINNLLSDQLSTQNLIRQKYHSELEAIRGHQKNEYRDWITSQVAQTVSVSSPATTPGNRSSMFVTQGRPNMEESFTIHLGSQLKYMHNIRIMSADVTELCSPLHNDEQNLAAMALGLYSSSLCAVVVLTKSGSVSANKKIFKNANMSTEFHFDQIEKQLDKIENDLKKCKELEENESEKSCKLKPGDFFITKHSNLSQTHVIFHLISDEPWHSPSEINSRHPVILGLRNIMKIACRYDVTMLTIPALLCNEITEDMTMPWCSRRAELVFKCAKGFMIESASWGGSELSTLQLLLPCNISEELFTSLSNMVPNVFRVANPKVLQESLSVT